MIESNDLISQVKREEDLAKGIPEPNQNLDMIETSILTNEVQSEEHVLLMKSLTSSGSTKTKDSGPIYSKPEDNQD